MTEWKPIEGFEGYYEVSSDGQVRSLDRTVPGPWGPQKLKGRILRPAPSVPCGHFTVLLCKDGNQKSFRIHALVAEAFLGSCPPGLEVRHGPNGVKDNSVANLSYGTHKQNLREDKRRDGTHGGRAVIRSDGRWFLNMAVAAEETGCHGSHISSCCIGHRKTTGGFGWRHANPEESHLNGKKRPVIRSDGREFPSLSAAANTVGSGIGNISLCCQGKTKTVKGFGWKYA